MWSIIAYLWDERDHEGIQPTLWVVDLLFDKAGVHNVVDPVDGEGRLCDVRGHNNLQKYTSDSKMTSHKDMWNEMY